MASEPVLVDTSCWIEYFNRPAVVNGLVLAELLQGARITKEASEPGYALGAVTWVETFREVYGRAGELGFQLRRRGATVPVTDCVIAASSETSGGRMLTLDAHFEDVARVGSITLLQV